MSWIIAAVCFAIAIRQTRLYRREIRKREWALDMIESLQADLMEKIKENQKLLKDKR